MPELVGDNCAPSTFILPIHEGAYKGARSGEMFLSGDNIWFNSTESAREVVTSG